MANSGAKAEDSAVEEEADDGSDPNEADGNGDETDRRKGAGGDVRRDGGDGSNGGGGGGEPLLADSRATFDPSQTVEHVAAAATSTPAELRPILPMLAGVAARATDEQRLPRLLRYPSFNLTWTRSAPPPRSDGWKPTDAQRLRLPPRDLKESYFRSCAVVGSSGTLRRSGYGPFIDAHEAVIRFNGAPAGGGYGADVGARTTLSVLADIATSECVDNKAKQPFLGTGGSHVASASSLAGARLDASNLVLEAAPSWRPVRQCDFYPETEPPATIFFLPRRGAGCSTTSSSTRICPPTYARMRSQTRSTSRSLRIRTTRRIQPQGSMAWCSPCICASSSTCTASARRETSSTRRRELKNRARSICTALSIGGCWGSSSASPTACACGREKASKLRYSSCAFDVSFCVASKAPPRRARKRHAYEAGSGSGARNAQPLTNYRLRA